MAHMTTGNTLPSTFKPVMMVAISSGLASPKRLVLLPRRSRTADSCASVKSSCNASVMEEIRTCKEIVCCSFYHKRPYSWHLLLYCGSLLTVDIKTTWSDNFIRTLMHSGHKPVIKILPADCQHI